MNLMVLFFSNVSIPYSPKGGWEGWRNMAEWDQVEGVVRTPLEHPWHPHNGPCHISRPERQWEQSYVPTIQLTPSIGAIVPVVIFGELDLSFDTLGMDRY